MAPMVSRGFIYTFLSAFAWAVSIILTKYLLRSGESVYNLGMWVALVELPVWAYLVFRKKRHVGKLTPKRIALFVGYGLVSNVGVLLAELFALQYSPAVNFSFLIRMVIVFTMLLSYVTFGESFTKKKVLLAAALLVGGYFVATGGARITLTLGDVFTLTEAFLIAVGNILTKLIVNRLDPDVGAGLVFLFGFIPQLALLSFLGDFSVPAHPIAVLLVPVSYIVLTRLRFRAMQLTSPTYVTMIFSFTPVFVLVMAAPLFGESLTVFQAIGGLLIVLAGIGVEKLKI